MGALEPVTFEQQKKLLLAAACGPEPESFREEGREVLTSDENAARRSSSAKNHKRSGDRSDAAGRRWSIILPSSAPPWLLN